MPPRDWTRRFPIHYYNFLGIMESIGKIQAGSTKMSSGEKGLVRGGVLLKEVIPTSVQ